LNWFRQNLVKTNDIIMATTPSQLWNNNFGLNAFYAINTQKGCICLFDGKVGLTSKKNNTSFYVHMQLVVFNIPYLNDKADKYEQLSHKNPCPETFRLADTRKKYILGREYTCM
ncbi:hypothetical protein L9F63_014831, partial [Diploptera punctata]